MNDECYVGSGNFLKLTKPSDPDIVDQSKAKDSPLFLAQ